MLRSILSGLLAIAVRQARRRASWLWWLVAALTWVIRRTEIRRTRSKRGTA